MAISSRLLKHTVTYIPRTIENNDGYDTRDTELDSTELHNVYITNNTRVMVFDNLGILNGDAYLFYDLNYSYPDSFVFKKDDIIEYKDVRYTITQVHESFNDSHIEITLGEISW